MAVGKFFQLWFLTNCEFLPSVNVYQLRTTRIIEHLIDTYKKIVKIINKSITSFLFSFKLNFFLLLPLLLPVSGSLIIFGVCNMTPKAEKVSYNNFSSISGSRFPTNRFAPTSRFFWCDEALFTRTFKSSLEICSFWLLYYRAFHTAWSYWEFWSHNLHLLRKEIQQIRNLGAFE